MVGQGVARLVEADVLGQLHRQLVVGHPDRPAPRAVDDRHRGAPIALAGDAPIPQAIDGGAFALALGFDARDGRRLGRLHVHAVHEG